MEGHNGGTSEGGEEEIGDDEGAEEESDGVYNHRFYFEERTAGAESGRVESAS